MLKSTPAFHKGQTVLQSSAAFALTSVHITQDPTKRHGHSVKKIEMEDRLRDHRHSLNGGASPMLSSSVNFTERLLQPHGRYKVDIAKGAPHYMNNTPMVPYFTKPLYKSKVIELGTTRSMDLRATVPTFNPNATKEVEKFQIGYRQIRRVDNDDTNRINTPNPYVLLNARGHASSSNTTQL